MPQGLQAFNIGRDIALLSEKLPLGTGGVTVSRYCASSLESIRNGANSSDHVRVALVIIPEARSIATPRRRLPSDVVAITAGTAREPDIVGVAHQSNGSIVPLGGRHGLPEFSSWSLSLHSRNNRS